MINSCDQVHDEERKEIEEFLKSLDSLKEVHILNSVVEKLGREDT